MILKYFELSKINLKKNNVILFYGKNEGLKKESINLLLKDSNNSTTFDEKEVLQMYFKLFFFFIPLVTYLKFSK